MAKIFMRETFSQREIYEAKYKTSRMNLLLVVVFTAINMVLLVANADTYFLFSAFFPYFITGIGMLLCGRFPEEYYTEEFADFPILDNSVFVVLLIISIVLTLFYLLAWFMSNKNRVGWLIFALVFFGLDTLGMIFLGGFSLETIFDILFHAWVIYYLILGINAHYKLKNLPPEEEPTLPDLDETAPENVEATEGEEGAEPKAEEAPKSPIIREADKNVKCRVLLEKRMLNYDICYRRVKHTNELVINGNVYDELEGKIEPAHTLCAWVDGHYIEVGYTGSHSFIAFDGNELAKKIRIF